MSNVVPPRTRKGLLSFLGLISFYRRFLPNLASLTAPLTDMLKKNNKEPMLYEKHQIECFGAISSALTSRPILKLPYLSKPFFVRSDSSCVAVEAMLLPCGYALMPFRVAYTSRKLTPSERNFSTIERECLAIIFSVHTFSVYLLGKPFILEVDHSPLVYLSKMKNLSSVSLVGRCVSRHMTTRWYTSPVLKMLEQTICRAHPEEPLVSSVCDNVQKLIIN